MIITTERFLLRALTIKDATDKYLRWLGDEKTSKFIINRQDSIRELEQYILTANSNQNCRLLGIFEHTNDEHIGNIKLEPIDFEHGEAVMGILIGDTQWHGRGVAVEVIKGLATAVKGELNLSSFRLGVYATNHAAISAYEKIGFNKVKKGILALDPNFGLEMRWIFNNE